MPFHHCLLPLLGNQGLQWFIVMLHPCLHIDRSLGLGVCSGCATSHL